MFAVTLAVVLALSAGLHVQRPHIGFFTTRRLGDPTYVLKSKLEVEIANGFSSRFSVMPLDSRLKVLSQASSADPCEAKLLTGGFGSPFGFGARTWLATSEIQLALYFNISFAICDGDATHAGIGWSKYFENTAGLSVCVDAMKCLRSETAAGWLGNNMTRELMSVDFDFQANLKRTIVRTLFTYGQDTTTRAEGALQAAGLEDGARYIGIHMRRGDKIAEARRLPSEDYARVALEQMREFNISTIFVASDDEHAGDEMMKTLQVSIPGASVLQLFSWTSIDRDYAGEDAATMAFLTDIFALRRAEVFIGTQSSATSRLAYFLRDEDAAASISLDGDWLDFYK